MGYGWTHFPHQMVTRQAHGPLPRAPHSLLQDADSLRTFSSVVRSIPNPFNFPPVSPCAPQGTVSFLGTRAFWSMAEFCDNIYSTFIFCHVKKKKKKLNEKRTSLVSCRLKQHGGNQQEFFSDNLVFFDVFQNCYAHYFFFLLDHIF